jgi:hypothetical protein
MTPSPKEGGANQPENNIRGGSYKPFPVSEKVQEIVRNASIPTLNEVNSVEIEKEGANQKSEERFDDAYNQHYREWSHIDFWRHQDRFYQPLLAQKEAEIDRLKREHGEYVAGKITLEDIAVKNGSMTASMGTEMAKIMANQFYALLKESKAENYVEMQFTDPDKQFITVTVQRHEKKTPHQFRIELEKEIERLKEMVGAANDFVHSIDTAINMGYAHIHRDDVLLYLGVLRTKISALPPHREGENKV